MDDKDIVSTRDIYNVLIDIESALLNIHDMLYTALNQPQDEEDNNIKTM